MSEESLLDGAGEGTETTETTTEQHAWFWQDEMQGEGETPEWFKGDKYKTVADQAKAYTEAEKRLGAFTGAPEEYSLDLPEGYELPEGVEATLDKEDPLAVAFTAWGKENNVSQKAFSDMLAMYMDQQVRDYEAMTGTAQAEMERLGDTGASRLDALAKWGKANMDEELFEKFRSAMVTADAVEAFEYVIGKTRNAQMPDPTNINPNLMATKRQELLELQDAKDENGKLKWVTDPIHRAKIERLQKEIYGTEEYREVVG